MRSKGIQLCVTKTFKRIIDTLLIKPFQAAPTQVIQVPFPRLIIIDGLDECNDIRAQVAILDAISRFFRKHDPRFPVPLQHSQTTPQDQESTSITRSKKTQKARKASHMVCLVATIATVVISTFHLHTVCHSHYLTKDHI